MTNAWSRLLLHQQHGAAALDFAGDLAVHVCRHASHAARKNFATFSDKFFQEIGVLVIDCFESNIDPAPRHGAIGTTERGTALWCFWLHRWLLGFAVQCMSPQKWIVFLFLEPVRSARAFLVSRRHVTRDRLTESFGLGAFKCDNFLRHSRHSFVSVGVTSSSSVSPPSSSVKPNKEVTD
jgi:hypothetical protein